MQHHAAALLMATLALGVAPIAASAASLNNHYEIDLENYRACKIDANGHRLSTCTGDDVRSASKYYLSTGTQGSISVTNAGVVKARIDGLAMDTGVSFPCPYQTDFDCNEGAGVCATGPGSSSVPKWNCLDDDDCDAYACDGGPQNDRACNPVNPDATCRSLANVTGVATVVFGGNQHAIAWIGGAATFKLIGDAGDAENGCTKICTMDTDATGKVDSNGLSCSVTGDAGCSTVEPYHVVKVFDMDGKVVAVPGVGAAFVMPSAFGVNDPVRYGDVCRGGSPPADCADDQ